MYKKIIDEITTFLTLIHIDSSAINPAEFQGVFVKKLSNQNIIKAKRRIPKGSTISPTNQTHIDITGKNGMNFFFESLKNTTTSIQPIDIDIFSNNLSYLSNINSVISTAKNGQTVFSRKNTSIAGLTANTNIYHSFAYKKYGHTGDQVQLNIPNP